MPRHAPPPPVTPVDPYAATEPVLTETLEQNEVPIPPAAAPRSSPNSSTAPPRRPGRTRRPKLCIGPRRWKQRRDALLRGLESRPRDPHTDRIRGASPYCERPSLEMRTSSYERSSQLFQRTTTSWPRLEVESATRSTI